MRLVLCTLYFPPCIFTPANRTYSWAKYLHEFDIYPIVITRQWSGSFSSELYENESIGNEVRIEKFPGYEVHYLPFKGNYRTRSMEKGIHKGKMSRRIYLAGELTLSNVFQFLLPYRNIFNYVLEYVKENKVDKVLISGSPFQLFKIGWLVNKKFKIPWIADYRDAWTEGNHKNPEGVLSNIVRRSNKYFERKWLKSASTFITVSPFLKNCIESYIHKKGAVIFNGFFKEVTLPQVALPDRSYIHFLYSGTMYSTQNYPSMVNVFKKLMDRYRDKIDIRVQFLGTAYNNEEFNNHPVFMRCEKNFNFTERVSYEESKNFHREADVFLMLGYNGVKGIATSKLFDYIQFQKPIVLFGNDKDIVEEILTKSGLGIIADEEKYLELELDRLIQEKLKQGFINQPLADKKYIDNFSRKNQAKHLAAVLKEG